MSNLRAYIEDRIKLLRNDIAYWEVIIHNVTDCTPEAHCREMIQIKRAIISELETVLLRCEES